jgi:hypothetical protein
MRVRFFGAIAYYFIYWAGSIPGYVLPKAINTLFNSAILLLGA